MIGIYNETDPLKFAALWGPVGAEALLAQLYPPTISLFFADFNVLKARQEALDFAKALNNFGVKTFFVRDEVAKNIKPIKMTLEQLITKLGENTRELILQDVARYGEEKAVALNHFLCLKFKFPLGNLIYARDQMNVLLDKMIISSMTKPIREDEVSIYESVYKNLDIEKIHLPKGETFEGGDAYIHNGYIYMGVGVRTTLEAAKYIFEKLNPKDLEFAIVADRNPHSRSAKEQMDFMHLDTFSNPIGDDQIAVCEEEARRRRVLFLKKVAGKTRVIDSGLSFLEHLEKKEKDIVIIPGEEQESFGCNFLAIDNKTLILPLNSNKKTNERLADCGKQLVFQCLFESTRGYGAAHCMTGQLFRG